MSSGGYGPGRGSSRRGQGWDDEQESPPRRSSRRTPPSSGRDPRDAGEDREPRPSRDGRDPRRERDERAARDPRRERDAYGAPARPSGRSGYGRDPEDDRGSRRSNYDDERGRGYPERRGGRPRADVWPDATNESVQVPARPPSRSGRSPSRRPSAWDDEEERAGRSRRAAPDPRERGDRSRRASGRGGLWGDDGGAPGRRGMAAGAARDPRRSARGVGRAWEDEEDEAPAGSPGKTAAIMLGMILGGLALGGLGGAAYWKLTTPKAAASSVPPPAISTPIPTTAPASPTPSGTPSVTPTDTPTSSAPSHAAVVWVRWMRSA